MSLQVTFPWSGELEEGSHEIALPASVNLGGIDYIFKEWENGSSASVRTLNLTSAMNLTYTYEQVVVPPVCLNCPQCPAEFCAATQDEAKLLLDAHVFAEHPEPSPETSGLGAIILAFILAALWKVKRR